MKRLSMHANVFQMDGWIVLRNIIYMKEYFVAAQQSDSVTYIFLFIVFSIMVYHRILNIVPSAIW